MFLLLITKTQLCCRTKELYIIIYISVIISVFCSAHKRSSHVQMHLYTHKMLTKPSSKHIRICRELACCIERDKVSSTNVNTFAGSIVSHDCCMCYQVIWTSRVSSWLMATQNAWIGCVSVMTVVRRWSQRRRRTWHQQSVCSDSSCRSFLSQLSQLQYRDTYYSCTKVCDRFCFPITDAVPFCISFSTLFSPCSKLITDVFFAIFFSFVVNSCCFVRMR